MTVLVFVAAGMAALSLYQGIVSMAHGGEADRLQSHRLMFKRTAWQALAVVCVMAAMLAAS